MREPLGLLRRALPLLAVAVVAAVIYDGWIFYGRWKSAREGRQAQQEDEVKRARESIDMIGGTSFRIINFYATPQVVPRGAQARLCYGVFGARHARIEPGIGDVQPIATNCLQVTPGKDTEYTLTADDGAGHTAKQTVQIKIAH